MVVVNLNAEDDDRAYQCYDVGDPKSPDMSKDAENYKKCRTEPHHNECQHGYAIGIASFDGGVRLWHIAKYHADGCRVWKEIYSCHCNAFMVCVFYNCKVTKKVQIFQKFEECANLLCNNTFHVVRMVQNGWYRYKTDVK